MASSRYLLVAATAASLAAAASPATASAPKLKLGVYDCEAYNFQTGYLDYWGSAKLESGHRYQFAYDRHHSKLKRPMSGKYSISGTKMKFKGGGLKNATGKIEASTGGSSPHFALYYKGKSSGIACYYVKKP
jgi:hypothetical protein